MPKMDGLEVVQRIKGDEKNKSIPVISLTAKASQEDKAKGLDAGADDYIVKPFDPVELLARVRSMMRIKEMHDSLEEWNQTLEEKVRRWKRSSAWAALSAPSPPQIVDAVLKTTGATFSTPTAARSSSNSWTCGDLPPSRTTPSPRRSSNSSGTITRRWES